MTSSQAQRTGARHPRRIAIFGGAFDPIHNGHLAIARAADRRFNFDEIHFVPASRPPHKRKEHLAAFAHRFAMVALASVDHPHFIPSLAEAGDDFSGQQLHYSVDTVRHFRQVYSSPNDRLFFIIGADAFMDLPTWREYETLLGSCDFVVANRPGIELEALRVVVPPGLQVPSPGRAARGGGTPEPEGPVIARLGRSTVHLLDNVSTEVSATDVRRHCHKRQSIHGLVSARVEEYILKQGLYR